MVAFAGSKISSVMVDIPVDTSGETYTNSDGVKTTTKIVKQSASSLNTNFVSDETIENLLLNYTPWEANDELIKCANANGGKDNITVVNIDFNEVTKW